MIAKVRARFWIYCFCHILFVLLLLFMLRWCEACKIHKMHSQPPLFPHVAVVMKSWCTLTCSCYWSSQANGDSLAWRTLLHRSVILSVMATNKHTYVSKIWASHPHGHNNNVAADVRNPLTAKITTMMNRKVFCLLLLFFLVLRYFSLSDRFSFTAKQFVCTHGN